MGAALTSFDLYALSIGRFCSRTYNKNSIRTIFQGGKTLLFSKKRSESHLFWILNLDVHYRQQKSQKSQQKRKHNVTWTVQKIPANYHQKILLEKFLYHPEFQ